MLREVLLLILGFGLLITDLVDIVWTALGTHGGGPVSGPVSAGVWKVVRTIFRWWHNDRALSFVGSIMVVMLLVLWTGILWMGWFCVFSSNPDSIVDSRTRAPASAISRLYFTAYTISTMGNGDFSPSSPFWRVITAIATLGGLGTLTLAITFLLSVLTAVVEERQIGAYVSDMGGTPAKILSRAWNGERFEALDQHLLQLTQMVHHYTEAQLAYPVLHYFHSEKERTAASLRLAALNELLLLVDRGASKEVRLPQMVTDPLRDALFGLGEVISEEFVKPADVAPPPPRLATLRELGIPTVDEETFAHAVEEDSRTRRFFYGLLTDDCRTWERVYGE